MLEERTLSVIHYESQTQQHPAEIPWRTQRTRRPGEAFRLESTDDPVSDAMARNDYCPIELAAFHSPNEGMLSLRVFASAVGRTPHSYLALLRLGGQQHIYYFTGPVALMEFMRYTMAGIKAIEPLTDPEQWPPWSIPSQL